MNPWTSLLLATGACLALQGVAFVVARRIGNYGLVDPCWALCVVLAAAVHGHFGAAPFPRRAAVTATIPVPAAAE